MRVVALHPDVLVVTSRMWQTNAVLLRGAHERGADAGDAAEPAHEAMLVDSPYFADELATLPELAQQAGFPVEALLVTHADFDHLLGRFAFPALALGVGEATAERLRAEPGAAQRELRAADADHYVRRERPLSLGAVHELPVPGRLELGGEELELHPAAGHTADGMAILARHARTLLCGDYLSDVEIPMVSAGGSLDAYRATLARLAPLLERIEHAVPGHGSPLDREHALRVLDEDVDYLAALERGEERPRLPGGRDSARQRAIHADNLRRIGA
jgi:glyoxylase-like metal-dependent hydrolase (beta-lactamase superfamily II)